MSSLPDTEIAQPGPKNAWRVAETYMPEWNGRLANDAPDKFSTLR